MSDRTETKGRYSLIYLRPVESASDSSRMRNRLYALLKAIGFPGDLRDWIRADVGVPVGSTEEFFLSGDLRDILDAITTIYNRYLHEAGEYSLRRNHPFRWHSGVTAIFDELNLSYGLTQRCEVRTKVDQEFERSRSATLQVLESSRYENVASQLASGCESLYKAPPDFQNAIRGIFSSAEGLFKLMFPREIRLAGDRVAESLGPALNAIYASDAIARNSAQKILNSFKAWIDAAHFYRHEPGVEAIHQPPSEIAIELVSQGISFVRWLAQIDQRVTKQ